MANGVSVYKKIRYSQNGEEIIQYVREEGQQWWIDFAAEWDHTEIIEFIDVIPTQEQTERLNEIKHLNESLGGVCSDYVELGVFPNEPGHALETLQLKKITTHFEGCWLI